MFVVGATGVLGRSAVAALIDAGHRVTGVARTDDKAASLRTLGAEAVSIDIFDRADLEKAVDGHQAVCNFATRIPRATYLLKSGWKENDRLHRDLSWLLVDVAMTTGAERYLQHAAAFMYAEGGTRWLDEDAPLAPPPHGDALVHAEANVQRFTESGGKGTALRFGFFYGPEVPSARDFQRMARVGLFVPFPGREDAYLPWIHEDDLGSAVVSALTAPPGVYNVTDDEPLTRAQLGSALARSLGRNKSLRAAPKFITRLMGKRYDYMSRSQRVSNARFKKESGWAPMFPSSLENWPRR